MNPSTATAMFAPDHRRPRVVRADATTPRGSWRERLAALLQARRSPPAR